MRYGLILGDQLSEEIATLKRLDKHEDVILKITQPQNDWKIKKVILQKIMQKDWNKPRLITGML